MNHYVNTLRKTNENHILNTCHSQIPFTLQLMLRELTKLNSRIWLLVYYGLFSFSYLRQWNKLSEGLVKLWWNLCTSQW